MRTILIATSALMFFTTQSSARVEDWVRSGSEDGKAMYVAAKSNCVVIISSRDGKVISKVTNNYNKGDRILLKSNQGLGNC
ncbi:MAG: hypothetical protein ABJP66_18045 [Hyphomicrobiales bacterium]